MRHSTNYPHFAIDAVSIVIWIGATEIAGLDNDETV